ncbi:hypothetical protein GDO78_004899 [Eleutherodactylus coqui]|uniref:Uncharacterized protein n=1 Tax=Eleutherodactylus coqui TaxID=57060 RepID=A0A8J6KC61_ELECQ|nr:hypothetical protein GDO78_004899 [Eleutherodactylus coqui]
MNYKQHIISYSTSSLGDMELNSERMSVHLDFVLFFKPVICCCFQTYLVAAQGSQLSAGSDLLSTSSFIAGCPITFWFECSSPLMQVPSMQC